MFNIVFFVVLTSVLLQGTTVAFVAKRLGVDAPMAPKPVYPLEFNPMDGLKSELKELPVPVGSNVAGKSVVELGLPADFLIVLVAPPANLLSRAAQRSWKPAIRCSCSPKRTFCSRFRCSSPKQV